MVCDARGMARRGSLKEKKSSKCIRKNSLIGKSSQAHPHRRVNAAAREILNEGEIEETVAQAQT